MKSYQKRLANPKTVDPALIQPRKDHTLNAVVVDAELIPAILEELITNPKLSLVRAMNYSRTLYNQYLMIPLKDLMKYYSSNLFDTIEMFEFTRSIDPSTFRNYAYWFSRFLFHVVMFKYHKKYKLIISIDIKLIKVYMFSECRRGLKPETVGGILSAIKHMLYPLRKHFPWLYDDKILFQKFFKCLYKTFGRPRKKKIQITYFLMLKIVVKIDFTVLISIRNWVLVVFAHVGGFRGGEVCPAKWSDIAIDTYEDRFSGQKMTILILFLDATKTDNQGNGAVVTISCPPTASVFNIITLFKQYIKLLEYNGFENEFIFPSLKPTHRGLNKHITVSTMTHIFKKLYASIGGDPSEISSHSARGGMVEDAVAAGVPLEFIQRLGRWRSQAWRGYFHDEQFAQACATAQLNDVAKKYITDDSQKKNDELLKAIAKN